MNLDNITKIWLNNLSYMEHHSIDVITDFVLSTFDLGYCGGEYEYLDKILELFNPSKHTLNASIGILTWSRRQKDKLPHQKEYRDRIIQYCKDTDQYSDGLFMGIDD